MRILKIQIFKDPLYSKTQCGRKQSFFSKIFTRDRAFMPKKCFRWEHFCWNGREEKSHNFLLHNEQGGRPPVEGRPLNRTYFDEDLQKYWVNYSEHSQHYDFFELRKIVSDFLTVFEEIFLPRIVLREVRFKCSFTLINQQPPTERGFIELTSSRCLGCKCLWRGLL